MIRALVAGLCVVLGGCTANGPKYEQIQSAIPEMSPGSARVFFFRERGVSSSLRPEIRLNDVSVGRSVPGSFFFVDRPAGKYVAAVGREAGGRLAVPLEAGQVLYVRSYITTGAQVGYAQLELASKSQWDQALPRLAYIGTTISPAAVQPASTQRAGPGPAGPPDKARMEDLRGLLPK